MSLRYDTKVGLHVRPGSDTPSPGAMGVQVAFLLVKPSPHVSLTETNQPSPSAEVQFYTVGDINSVAESPHAATATTGSQQMTGGSGLYDRVNYFPIVTARLHTLICMRPQRALPLAEPRWYCVLCPEILSKLCCVEQAAFPKGFWHDPSHLAPSMDSHRMCFFLLSLPLTLGFLILYPSSGQIQYPFQF